MKHGIRCAIAALLLTAMLLTSCSGDVFRYDTETKGYVNADGKCFYKAPPTYLAVKIDLDREVGTLRTGSEEATLYAVCSYDEKSYLDETKFAADGYYNLYYAAGETLPALWEMQINLIRIVKNSTKPYSIGTIEKQAEIDTVVGFCQGGDAIAYNDRAASFRDSEPERHDLAFCSDVYSEFYYVLIYYRYEKSVTWREEVENEETFKPSLELPYELVTSNGKAYARYDLGRDFLYDRESGLCYPINGYLDSYFNVND